MRGRRNAQRQPHVVRGARALRVPRVAHEHVRRLAAAGDRDDEGRLRVNETNEKRNAIPVEPTVHWGKRMA